jgi:hypothetical protein
MPAVTGVAHIRGVLIVEEGDIMIFLGNLAILHSLIGFVIVSCLSMS